MKRLRDAGNTLLVVEHEPQIMFAADRILDLGPGPGERGGEVGFFGTPRALRDLRASPTADYLSGGRRAGEGTASHRFDFNKAPRITIRGAAEHNLKHVDVTIPLERLRWVTGVLGAREKHARAG